jgi:anti-anti-sigma factor
MAEEAIFSVRDEGEVKVVTFQVDTLGIDIAERLQARLASLVKGEKEPQVLLVLQDVGYIASPSIGALVNLNNLVKKAGGVVKATALSPYVQETFRVLHLDEEINIYPDEKTALASFS